MAEPTKTTATSSPNAEASPPAEGGATQSTPTTAGALSLPDFLASIGVGMAGDEAPKPRGDTAPDPEPPAPEPTPTPEAEEGDDSPKANPEEAAADTPATTDTDEADTLEVTDDGKIKLGANEKAIIKQMEDAKVSKAAIGRFIDSLKREKRSRLLRDEAERTASELKDKTEKLQAQLTETAEKSTIVPSGPLANLQSIEELDKAQAEVLADLRQEAEDPTGFIARFRDTDTATAEESAARWKQRCLGFLEAAKAQREIITEKGETRSKLRKQQPEIFNPTTEEGKFRQSTYQTDPRTRPDFDQLLADALRGRKVRADEESGKFKYVRVDLEAARANGALGAKAKPATNGHANGNGKEPAKATTTTTLPPPRQSLPATPAGRNRLQELRALAAQGQPVSVDEMMNAQMAE